VNGDFGLESLVLALFLGVNEWPTKASTLLSGVVVEYFFFFSIIYLDHLGPLNLFGV